MAKQPNHLVCRGNNKRCLFSYHHDRHTYLRLLAAALKQFDCRLHAVCLMRNHIHLLLTPPSVDSASACMKRVNQRYAQIRNQRRGGSGKLFEQRFFSDPIKDDRHLAFCTLYINANPYRANLPNYQNYLWSTQALHLGRSDKARIPSGLVTFSEWYLGLGKSSEERAWEYGRCFENYLLGLADPDYQLRVSKLEPATQRAPKRPDGSRASESKMPLWLKNR